MLNVLNPVINEFSLINNITFGINIYMNFLHLKIIYISRRWNQECCCEHIDDIYSSEIRIAAFVGARLRLIGDFDCVRPALPIAGPTPRGDAAGAAGRGPLRGRALPELSYGAALAQQLLPLSALRLGGSALSRLPLRRLLLRRVQDDRLAGVPRGRVPSNRQDLEGQGRGQRWQADGAPADAQEPQGGRWPRAPQDEPWGNRQLQRCSFFYSN